jgi:RimJ/RimL family protein N-acetyltransferase
MIQTDRLTLRPLETGDADWIARDIINPNVAKWLSSLPHPYHRADAEAFIALKANDPGYRVIVSDHPMGIVSIETANGTNELGYWLAQPYWGAGYMSEAARAMVDWHFDRSEARLFSGWIQGNAASENVLQKLGFPRTGVVKTQTVAFYGGPVQSDQVQLTNKAWAAARRA